MAWSVITLSVALALAPAALAADVTAAPPSFYKDVLPIFQNRCQICHRPGEIGTMPLVDYQGSRPWAKAIKAAVVARKMPPWFADPCCGKFSNDRSLTAAERDTISTCAALTSSAACVA